MDVPEELNETVLPQKVVAPLTRAAIFLVVCIRQDPDGLCVSVFVLRRPFRARPRR